MAREGITSLADTRSHQSALPLALGSVPPISPPRVLVAEDDPDVRSLVRRVLEAEGCAVDVVCDGQAALERCRQDRPDLLVLDVMMPRLTGFEVIAHLRQDAGSGTMPVLILSARDSESDIVSGFDLGISDYVTKPFRIAELRARVRSLIARSRRP